MRKVTKSTHRGLSPVYPLKGSGIVLSLRCRRSSADYFGKTLPFSFRCRCAGADLQALRSLAPPQPQANQQRRRHPVARKSITTTIGAAAIISGFVCRFTPRRSVERCITGLRSRKKWVLRGKTLERRMRPSAFGADRVFPLSVSLPTFCTSRK